MSPLQSWLSLLIYCTVISAQRDHGDTHSFFGAVQRAPGAEFIGRGYNLIKGNPDGLPLGSTDVKAASDPGLMNQNWLLFTYKDGRLDSSGQYALPDDVVYNKEDSCTEGKSSKMILGGKSYQQKLKSSVSIGTSFDGGLWSLAFSAGLEKESSSSKSVKSQKVFFEEAKVCVSAKASYRFAQKDGDMEISDDMRRQICRLPDHKTNKYFDYLDYYGTHVITQVTLGNKQVWRKQTSYKSFTKKVINKNSAKGNVGGSYLGVSASASMTLDSDKITSEKNDLFEEGQVHWNIGTADDPRPIELGLQSIEGLFSAEGKFWKFECAKPDSDYKECCGRLPKLHELMKNAIIAYPGPEWLNVQPPSDPPDYEIVWPQGHWALPRTNEGCPKGVGFKFETGTIFQDTMETNRWFRNIHFSKSQLDETSVSQRWCAKKKNDASQYELPWPAGDYCVAKMDNACPEGFLEGFIKFQDSKFMNKNFESGKIPEGEYDTKGETKIIYCCRNDGEASKEIFLPTDTPFYLIQRDRDDCQAVQGMNKKYEWVEWARSTWIREWKKEEFVGGELHPHLEYKDETIRLGYCYYYPNEEEKSSGKLHFNIKSD